MHYDAVDLKEFYETTLGKIARRQILRRLRRFWPDVKGQRILGIGYPTPFFNLLAPEAERLVALMPPAQGALPWPPEGPGMVTLSSESELPFPNVFFDKVIIVHNLEVCQRLHEMMREVGRVMVSNGRLLIITPNRAGVWARADHTPFGQGSPFTAQQIRNLLRDHQFVPERLERGLFMPPLRSSRLVLSAAPVWERVGERFFNTFGGLNFAEASKQLYAGQMVGAASAIRRHQPGLVPAA